MSTKKKTEQKETETLAPIKPVDKPRKPSKKAAKELAAKEAEKRKQKVCVVCGKRGDKMFASAGKGEWVCCTACLARYGRIHQKQ